ncbi:guanine nucleotide-binding protein G(I)/G(S)/G(O) subunit gamma-10-like [Dromiciops gliroides]|uniref:guanine nucleotide-binding protein G(I)/G(S)/G(O) subunit gamma-10-like n=1 Tax=Dromiciops gliroides TaxID=33562 RepID=UPI001CC7319F|nr:guanine nucleotide-binding protein G(I)/G(S)/G(O) subunit gamma-10-like [Dromiciops gliroides]
MENGRDTIRIAPASLSSSSSPSTMQGLAEQLKLEVRVERIKISQAASKLQQYFMQNACKDVLMVGVPEGSNPFPELRSYILILWQGRSSLRSGLQVFCD